MTKRERIRAAVERQSPDRVPVDFNSTAVTGMHVTCVAALRDHYGLEKRPVKLHEPYQMLGWIDDDLADVLGIDTCAVQSRYTIFGFVNENWKPWRTNTGLEVLVSEHFNTTTDDNGDTLIYPQGDTSAPPSGRMPRDGFYFDTIVRQEPIDEDNLDPADNLEEFAPICDEDVTYLQTECARARQTGRAVVVHLPGTAFGDIALVPAPFLKHPKGIRDIAEWYMSTAMRQDYVRAVFETQCRIALDNLARIHAAVGDNLDVAFICGTDFGTQTSSFCSVDTMRDLYLPYYKRINDWIHEPTTWKTFKHSCGAVEPFINAFIDAGFDILNPVQCSAAGMDPETLKAKYGDRIAFWGGAVDTQKTLPFGTPEQVRAQVLRRCEVFAPGGGFIFNAIHNVQPNTPVENIVAMMDALREFNGA
jgi:hypothetical protein